MRILIATMVLLLMLLQSRLWLSAQGLPELRQLQESVGEQQASNAQLRRQNQALAADVSDLREGLDAAEERARAELGLIRRGETFYQVVMPE